jgi:hypothetical protein
MQADSLKLEACALRWEIYPEVVLISRIGAGPPQVPAPMHQESVGKSINNNLPDIRRISMSKPVNYRETLVAYLHSDTIEDAAKELNIAVSVLKARIATMRAKGVNIPKLSRTTLGALEVAQLNSLIKKYSTKKES